MQDKRGWLRAGAAATVLVSACGFFTHLAPSRGGGGDPGAQSDAGTYMGGPTDQVVDGGSPPVVKMSCGDSVWSDPWSPGYVPDPNVQSAARAMAGSMSLSERADQMRGTSSGSGSTS